MSGLAPYLTLVGTLTLAILSPGPAIVSAIQTAMSRGRDQAMPYSLGLAFGASLWCLCALLGLAALLRVYPGLYAGLTLLGGAYLVWIGWQMWRAAPEPLPDAATGARKTFAGGVLLNLANPKPALFYAALILSVFPEPLGALRQASIYAAALTTELFWYIAVTLAMSTNAMRARYRRAKIWIDRAAGLAIIVLGVLLILDR
ncbi:MAG: LysE family translocator [Paracoccus sp. (in: a-proteobacteria)]|nr:LysE family translocator [Paracoccus sp. (in: a-proteobacteria)]